MSEKLFFFLFTVTEAEENLSSLDAGVPWTFDKMAGADNHENSLFVLFIFWNKTNSIILPGLRDLPSLPQSRPSFYVEALSVARRRVT